jgi:hypothetical protein
LPGYATVWIGFGTWLARIVSDSLIMSRQLAQFPVANEQVWGRRLPDPNP